MPDPDTSDAPRTLGDLAAEVRSKNAGPFWMTLKAFMPDDQAYRIAGALITPELISDLYHVAPAAVQIFRVPELNVVKVSWQAGFILDVDYHPAAGFRVVQLTPPGSACSIQIGAGLTDAPPGSARATYLAVTDIEAARQELGGRGVTVSDIRHKSPIDDWTGGFEPGADSQRRDYASVADFADPDGNTWIIQEIGYRPPQEASGGQPPD